MTSGRGSAARCAPSTAPTRKLFGFFDWMHHHIGSTHVCHHLFSNLPCYHAVEATKHVKAYLKPLGLYNYDHDGVIQSMWKAAKSASTSRGPRASTSPGRPRPEEGPTPGPWGVCPSYSILISATGV